MSIATAGSPQPAATHSSADRQINLSLGYIRANQPGRALPLLDEVLAAQPNNAIAWNNRCVAHTMLMSYNLGIEDCKQALHIDPEFQLAKNNLKWSQDEFAKTQSAIAEQEQTPPTARNAAFYLAEGLNFMHMGGYDQAIRAWQRTLALDLRNALAANNIGSAYMAKGDSKTALAWFSKALALNPHLEIARNNVTWARSEIHKPDERTPSR
jgi:tetratricopeptide (TPR) repeat protein